MATFVGDHVDVPLASSFHELMELGSGKSSDICGASYAVENRDHRDVSREWRERLEL
jgi:hypothetical protein